MPAGLLLPLILVGALLLLPLIGGGTGGSLLTVPALADAGGGNRSDGGGKGNSDSKGKGENPGKGPGKADGKKGAGDDGGKGTGKGKGGGGPGKGGDDNGKGRGADQGGSDGEGGPGKSGGSKGGGKAKGGDGSGKAAGGPGGDDSGGGNVGSDADSGAGRSGDSASGIAAGAGDEAGPESAVSPADGTQVPPAGEAAAGATIARRDDSGNDRERSGEIVVVDQGPGFLREARGLGFRIIGHQRLGALGITVTRLALPSGLTPASAQALLRDRFPTMLAAANGLYRPQGSLSLPPLDYAERLIGWGHPPRDCGRGIAIGLIDTGLAADHPTLAGRSIETRSFLGAGEPSAPRDHGTAVAGILVGAGGDGQPAGLLPGATLRLAEAFTIDESGRPVASVVAVVAALDWLVETRTPVVNLSLTGADNLLLSLAASRALARGVVLVAAAGNGGADGPPAYPAAYPDVLAVAAVDRHLRPFREGTRGDYIDLAAPGVGIVTAAPSGGLALATGSSYAAPYVAAAAAVRIAGGLSEPESVRKALAQDARDLGDPGWDAVFGWGLLQAANACRDLVAQP